MNLFSPTSTELQLALLAFAVFFPLVLLLYRKHNTLVAWICLVCCIDIFNTHILLNLPAASLVGLFVLPGVLDRIGRTLRAWTGRLVLLNLGYLALLGLIFGFLLPWPNYGAFRDFNQNAQGRSLIYLVHQTANISLAIYLADYLRTRERLAWVLRCLVVSATLASSAGIFEYLTRIDIYHALTGLRSLELEYRFRGLNFEPRGLGLIACYGTMLCLARLCRRHANTKQNGAALAMLAVNLLAIFLTLSTSAAAALVAASGGLFIFDRRARLRVGAAAVILASFVLGVAAASPTWAAKWTAHSDARIIAPIATIRTDHWTQALGLRLGILDGPPVFFFADHPWYLITGTGPGLITLPATHYVLDFDVGDWLWTNPGGQGLNSPPSIGFLLELANAGLTGLFLWGGFLAVAWKSLRRLAQLDDTGRVAATAFLAACLLYCVQASPTSAIIFIFIGIGIGGERLAAGHPVQAFPALPRHRFELVAAAGR